MSSQYQELTLLRTDPVTVTFMMMRCARALPPAELTDEEVLADVTGAA